MSWSPLALLVVAIVAVDATDVTWTGAASDLWSDSGNWVGSVPRDGSNVDLPASRPHRSNRNDWLGLALGSLNVSVDGYAITGSAVTTGSVRSYGHGDASDIGLPIILPDDYVVVALRLNAEDFNSLTVLSAGILGRAGNVGMISKVGAGVFRLTARSAFDGPVRISEGRLEIANDDALGSIVNGTEVVDDNGPDVGDAGGLGIAGGVTCAEPLLLSGPGPYTQGTVSAYAAATPAVLTGPISLPLPIGDDNRNWVTMVTEPGGFLHLRGPISGPGSFKIVGDGEVALLGDAVDTYTGATFVVRGRLRLGRTGVIAVPGELDIGINYLDDGPARVVLSASEQIADASTVAIGGSGTLDLAGQVETIGPFSSYPGETTATVELGSGHLYEGADTGDDNAFTGPINGSGGLHHRAGRLTLTGTKRYTGVTEVSGGTLVVAAGSALSSTSQRVVGGTLQVDGAFAGASTPLLTLTSGFLTGNGTVGGIVAGGGVISPGGDGVGQLTANGDVTLAGGTTLRVDLLGPAPSAYDALIVEGDLTVGGALDVHIDPATFNPPFGTSFVIVRNDTAHATGGGFTGLPEGARAVLGGVLFAITYVGNTGNDVVLVRKYGATATAVSGTPSPAAPSAVVTLTATVTAPGVAGTPGGTVQFSDGGVALGAPVALVGSAATLTTSSLALGAHAITARYSGDRNFDPSTSARFSEVISSTPSPPPGGGSSGGGGSGGCGAGSSIAAAALTLLVAVRLRGRR